MATMEDRLAIGPEMAGTLMTPEEFDSVEEADEEFRYELIQGVLVVTPPPSAEERGPNELVAHLLRAYQEQHPRGKSLDYTVGEHTVRTHHGRRRADRVIWAGLGRKPRLRRDVPTIVIEFVSEGLRNRQRDYEAKRDEYRAAGVAEYWVIDRFRRTMTVYRQLSQAPSQSVVAEHETYTTPLLPGFELPLARVLAEVDAIREMQAEEDASS